MSGIRTTPYPSKYIVDMQGANGEKYFSSHFDFQHLLTAAGGTGSYYTDLTELAKGFYAQSSNTISEGKAPFLQWLKGTSGVKDVKHNEVRWRTYSKPIRTLTSLGDANNEQITYLGSSGKEFLFRTEINHLQPSDWVSPVENGRAQIEIVDHGRSIPGGTEYRAVLVNKDTFIPREYLKVGKLWKRSGQAASHLSPLSGRAGTFSFNVGFSYIEFGIPMHTMTKEMSIDEETHLMEGSLMVAAQFDDNTMIAGITNKMEMEFEASFEREMQEILINGQMTRGSVDPVSRKPYTTTPGLYAYLEESNIITYNPFTNSIDMIIDQIKSYWYDRVPVNQRNLVLMTGSGGLELWNKWIVEKFGAQAVQVTENFVLKSSESWDSNKKGFELGAYQFTKYSVQPFGSVAVGYMPMFDDTLFDAKYMPGSSYTIRSHEFMAFDWGVGQPNVQLLERSNKSRDIQIPGFWSSYGPVGMKNPLFKTVGDQNIGDAYLIRKSRTFGLAVMDVSRILLFRPSA